MIAQRDAQPPLLAPMATEGGPAPQSQQRVQSGDIWKLGAHRLLCGDATKARDVTRLMAGEQASACITDPPYNVGLRYAGAFAGQDSKTPAQYGRWLRSTLRHAENHIEPGSLVFVWQAMANAQHYHQWFAGRDWRIFASCKNFIQMRPTWMQYAVDPVICWTHGKRTGKSYVMRDWHIGITSNTKRTPDRVIRGAHPCPRPLDTVQWLIEQATAPDAIVYDAFLGSGTTLIAAEVSGRRCYGLEIEPTYCDIILARWEQATGRHAVLLKRRRERA